MTEHCNDDGKGGGRQSSSAADAAAAKAKAAMVAAAAAAAAVEAKGISESIAKMKANADAKAEGERAAAAKAQADAHSQASKTDGDSHETGSSANSKQDGAGCSNGSDDGKSGTHASTGSGNTTAAKGSDDSHVATGSNGSDDGKKSGTGTAANSGQHDDRGSNQHADNGHDDDRAGTTTGTGGSSGSGSTGSTGGTGPTAGPGTGTSGASSGGSGSTGSTTPPPPPPPPEAITLKTADVSNIGTGALKEGTSQADTLNASTGHDIVLGKGGNDTIHGADVAPVTLALPIDGSLINAANANAISFLVSGVPSGTVLSAGQDNGNGTWSLSKADLPNLAITTQNGADFTLKVVATATDGSALSQAADLHVVMHAGQGNILSGGNGNDTIFGSANGDDAIYGGGIPTGVVHTHTPTVADNDTIFVGNGNAHVWGQAGNDTIWGGGGKDWISGGTGNDTIHAGSGYNIVHGNVGDDVLVAGTGTGILSGGDGNDVFKAGADAGTYTVYGGAGFDTLDFSGAANGVSVDLHKHTATGDGNLTLSGIEAVMGSSHDDVMWGSKGSNVFTGGGGNDTFGFHKSDVKAGATAHVTDFNVGDHIDLSEMLKGNTANDHLRITDGANGETVSVKIGSTFHDVVVLDHLHGMTAQDMLAHGMILA